MYKTDLRPGGFWQNYKTAGTVDAKYTYLSGNSGLTFTVNNVDHNYPVNGDVCGIGTWGPSGTSTIQPIAHREGSGSTTSYTYTFKNGLVYDGFLIVLSFNNLGEI